MTLPGYYGTVYFAATSASMTDEACSAVSTLVYQITSSTKRSIDPSESVSVEVDGSVTAIDYTVDYLWGKIIFASDPSPSAGVTVTANYMVQKTLGTCSKYEIDLSNQLLDSTAISLSNSHRTRQNGLNAGKLSLTCKEDGNVSFDSTTLNTYFEDESFLFIKLITVTGGGIAAWGYINKTLLDSSVEDQVTFTIEVDVVANGSSAAFGWYDRYL